MPEDEGVAFLNAALSLAADGFSVIPLQPYQESNRPACKKPLLREWTSFQRTSAPEKQIEAWWRRDPDANIAIVTGEVSKMFVVDIDSAEGLESFEGLKPAETLCAITSQEGEFLKRQYFFKSPGFLVPNDYGDILTGCEILGEGHYVVVPPSSHPTGFRRYWTSTLNLRDQIKNAPPKLLEELRKKAEPTTKERRAKKRAKRREEKDLDQEAEYLLARALEQATPQTRNNIGFWLYCQLRDAGLAESQADSYRIKYVELSPAGDHPYTLAESLLSLKQAYKAPAREPRGGKRETKADTNASLYMSFRRSDAGFGELFNTLSGDDIRYDHLLGRWLLWDDVRWAPDLDEKIHRVFLKDTRLIEEEVLNYKGTKREFLQWVRSYENVGKRNQALTWARAYVPITTRGTEFDADPTILGVANGLIDLNTGKFHEGRREKLITLSTHVNYNEKADAPRFKKFLLEIFNGDKTLVEFMHYAVGFCLTGLTQPHGFFILYGIGRNGKTTFLNAISRLLGDYAHTAAFDTLKLDIRRSGSQATPDLRALMGKRLITARETRASQRLDEERIKMLTGGDPITCRGLYEQQITFEPKHKLWLAVNHLPNIKDTSPAMWERVRLVPFDRIFKQNEQDQYLEDKLRRELPGILNWAIEGCQKFFHDGLSIPERVSEATNRMQEESDPVRQYFAERIVENATAEIKAKISCVRR